MDTPKSLQQQQENDAALAQRLHEELNGPGVAQRSSQNVPVRMPKNNTVQCPACTYINTFEFGPGSQNRCIQCNTEISPGRITGALNEAGHKQDLEKCNACLCINRIPEGTYDAILCGGCCKELKRRMPTADTSPLPEAFTAKRQLQVRCGECSCINAVEADVSISTIRFECGSCQSINEVSL